MKLLRVDIEWSTLVWALMLLLSGCCLLLMLLRRAGISRMLIRRIVQSRSCRCDLFQLFTFKFSELHGLFSLCLDWTTLFDRGSILSALNSHILCRRCWRLVARTKWLVNLCSLLQTLTSCFNRLAVFCLLLCISLSFNCRRTSHVACKMLLNFSCEIRWNSPILQDFYSLDNLTYVWAWALPCSFHSFIFSILVQLSSCSGIICSHFCSCWSWLMVLLIWNALS